MGHHTGRSGYEALVERLNRFPQGAPPTETLYKILGVLFSEREAALISKLPVQGFSAGEAASRWSMAIPAAVEVLDELASRAVLIDYEKGGEKHYVLPPPMAGWIEFSMMRMRTDIDQHALGVLLHQYMNVEEDFVKALFFGSDTKMVRAFVNEEVVPDHLEILDYQRATQVIETAEHIGVSMCYCRHKMDHVGKACDAPMDICMTFGKTADSLIRAEFARRISKEECLDLLEQAYDHHLVQIGENVQNEVAFICNCCGCCCEALLAAKKFGTSQTIATTAFLPEINQSQCVACGKCQKVCPLEALGVADKQVPVLNAQMCLGCGVCVRACPTQAITLSHVGQRQITPVNTAHRVVLMALDKGKLPELIYDNKDLKSHKFLAAVFNVLLELPPIKQLAASEQLRSKYLYALLSKRR